MQYDLIVIGAGIAGLSTATSAAEMGLSVCLLEKTDSIGGSSVMSGGWFAFTGTQEQAEKGISDSEASFKLDLFEGSNRRADERLIDAYLSKQHETYLWLKNHGAQFDNLEISSGMSVARGHRTDIKALLQRLHEEFESLGGTSVFNVQVARLIKESNRVAGVTTEEGREYRSAGGVVIASGGFSRSEDLLRIFAPEQIEAIPYGGRANTGDGLKMAWKLGAGLADMSAVSATYGSHPDTSEDFHELLTAYYLGAIIVNSQGKRFVDESLSYKKLGRAVLDQPGGLGFEVFDAKVRAQGQAGVPLLDMDQLEAIGHLHKADSLEELAGVLDVPADNLISTVNRYNSAIREGANDEHGRDALCNGAGALTVIEEAPFYGYPAKALMTSTYCGLTVEPNSSVTDVFGERIPGLYAVGEVTGGFHGSSYMTGTSLGKGAVFGHALGFRLASIGSQLASISGVEL